MYEVMGRRLDTEPFYGPLVHKECLATDGGPWKEITVLGHLAGKTCNVCGLLFICTSCSQGFVDSTGKCSVCN